MEGSGMIVPRRHLATADRTGESNGNTQRRIACTAHAYPKSIVFRLLNRQSSAEVKTLPKNMVDLLDWKQVFPCFTV